jgi:hypothetical protein
MIDIPLWRITEVPRPVSQEIASNIINAYRAILENKILFRDYLDSIRIMEDGFCLGSGLERFLCGGS